MRAINATASDPHRIVRDPDTVGLQRRFAHMRQVRVLAKDDLNRDIREVPRLTRFAKRQGCTILDDDQRAAVSALRELEMSAALLTFSNAQEHAGLGQGHSEIGHDAVLAARHDLRQLVLLHRTRNREDIPDSRWRRLHRSRIDSVAQIGVLPILDPAVGKDERGHAASFTICA